MSKKDIFQFKITLKHIKPPIWRRIQVPMESSFEEFHYYIQNAMGWKMCHNHGFEVVNPKTGEVDSVGPEDVCKTEGIPPTIPEKTVKLQDYFVEPKNDAIYEYDFGDGWIHEIIFEKAVQPWNLFLNPYPRCLAGKMACPPENSGGINGYKGLLKIIADPNHKEYDHFVGWLEDCGYEDFDPREFDPKSVRFYY